MYSIAIGVKNVDWEDRAVSSIVIVVVVGLPNNIRLGQLCSFGVGRLACGSRQRRNDLRQFLGLGHVARRCFDVTAERSSAPPQPGGIGVHFFEKFNKTCARGR